MEKFQEFVTSFSDWITCTVMFVKSTTILPFKNPFKFCWSAHDHAYGAHGRVRRHGISCTSWQRLNMT